MLSKEAMEKRQKALQEELQRGYFDDMKDLRDTDGRIGAAPETISPVSSSITFPKMGSCIDVYGKDIDIPPQQNAENANESGCLTFLSIAFRSGAQEHLNTWSDSVASNFAHCPQQIQMIELGLIDSWVMGLFPFKQTILSNAARLEAEENNCEISHHDKPNTNKLRMRQVFRFGDAESFRKSLNLHNKLAAFVFLLDANGRIRWRMSGPARQGEELILLDCINMLLSESKTEIVAELKK